MALTVRLPGRKKVMRVPPTRSEAQSQGRRRAERSGPTHRGGREATTAAILDAAEELFAERGFKAATVRAIAERAGVSHALVHRYLGSKADIFSTVLVRNARALLDVAPDDPDLLETASAMMRAGLTLRRPYVRLVAHSDLHGGSPQWPAGAFGATERLIDLARVSAASAAPTEPGDARLDPRFVITCIVALLVGWVVAEPFILPRAGLAGMDEAEVVDGVVRVMRGILRDNLPGLDGESPASG